MYKCHLINREEMNLFQQNASAYVIHGRDMNLSDMPPVTPRQLRVYMLMESPHHVGSALYRSGEVVEMQCAHQSASSTLAQEFGGLRLFWDKGGTADATMTYRRDSRYFYPYGQFVPLAAEDKKQPRLFVTQQQIADSLKRKTRGSLIFVSNCRTPSKREKLIKELGQHTEVTVRGKCEEQFSVGNETRRFSCKENCDDDALIATHRFYISYENSLCTDYITEKFYHRISQLLVPVVMRRRIYEGIVARCNI
ncbi:hypothetical protein COOONC_22725 [Cooperia oncophora]